MISMSTAFIGLKASGNKIVVNNIYDSQSKMYWGLYGFNNTVYCLHNRLVSTHQRQIWVMKLMRVIK
jgi:hypothetical protein